MRRIRRRSKNQGRELLGWRRFPAIGLGGVQKRRIVCEVAFRYASDAVTL